LFCRYPKWILSPESSRYTRDASYSYT